MRKADSIVVALAPILFLAGVFAGAIGAPPILAVSLLMLPTVVVVGRAFLVPREPATGRRLTPSPAPGWVKEDGMQDDALMRVEGELDRCRRDDGRGMRQGGLGSPQLT